MWKKTVFILKLLLLKILLNFQSEHETLRITQRKIFEMHMRLYRECREYLAACERTRNCGCRHPPPEEQLSDAAPEDLVALAISALLYRMPGIHRPLRNLAFCANLHAALG